MFSEVTPRWSQFSFTDIEQANEANHYIQTISLSGYCQNHVVCFGACFHKSNK